MSHFTPLSLDRFNQQVLACQDDAFTLAVSILGDERLAYQVIQEVIRQVYSRQGNDDNVIAVKVLQGVILLCRQEKPSRGRDAPEWVPGWNLLEQSEQEAILLVDVLGKTYRDAALLLNCSECDVARYVAFGRRKLTRSIHSKPELHKERMESGD
ncbi:MAG: hypothetical protein LLG42_02605 [Chloroflexi bacterium]|nr:hypothetical protein [Chloroflexota bacterium]